MRAIWQTYALFLYLWHYFLNMNFSTFVFRARTLTVLLLAIWVGAIISACSKDGDKDVINVFSVDDDIKLGQQLADQIRADPAQYPLLSQAQYPKAYEHLNRITQTLLNTGKIKYKDRFKWEINIIRDDSTLNAFCAPGGFIYVYTGIIKYLDSEDQFAGVLGHEIAHADRRHSTDRLTRQYGISMLLDLVLGQNKGALANVATNLALLAYSRSNETEADLASVEYLCATDYNATGTAGFFKKLIEQGQGGRTPAFLSTHPNPDKRVENIEKEAQTRNCTNTQTYVTRYNEFKNSLP